jgi:hypothetical protein
MPGMAPGIRSSRFYIRRLVDAVILARLVSAVMCDQEIRTEFVEACRVHLAEYRPDRPEKMSLMKSLPVKVDSRNFH